MYMIRRVQCHTYLLTSASEPAVGSPSALAISPKNIVYTGVRTPPHAAAANPHMIPNVSFVVAYLFQT